MNNTAKAVVVAAVSFLMGAALGALWSTSSSIRNGGESQSAATSPLSSPQPMPVPAALPSVPGDHAALVECLAEQRRLGAEVDAIEALMRKEQVSITGTEVPWSFNTDPAYSPEGAARAVVETLAGCPQAQMARTYIECDEYPCVVWAEHLGSAMPPLLTCPGWPYEPTVSGYHSRPMPDGSSVTFSILPIMPKGQDTPYGPDDFQRRLKFRREWYEEMVLSEWFYGAP